MAREKVEGAVGQRPKYRYKTVVNTDTPLAEQLEEHATDGWRFVADVDGELVFERLEQHAVVNSVAKRDDEEKQGLLRLFE